MGLRPSQALTRQFPAACAALSTTGLLLFVSELFLFFNAQLSNNDLLPEEQQVVYQPLETSSRP